MKNETGNGFFADVIRSVLYAIIATLFLILIFSVIVKFAELGSETIKIVNQFLKVLSIFMGLLFGMKNKEAGLKKGFATGLLFAVAAILLFSMLSQEKIFTMANLVEIGVSAIIGSFLGVIVLIVKK